MLGITLPLKKIQNIIKIIVFLLTIYHVKPKVSYEGNIQIMIPNENLKPQN